MPATPRAAQRTAETDVATRGPADDIRHRAYRLYQERGSQHGHNVEDWHLAEVELVEGNSTAVAPLSDEIQRRLG